MKIKFRDYITLSEESRQVPEQLLRTWDSSEAMEGKSLLIKIDATHSGRITNRRVYPGTKMKKAAKSWISTDRGGSSTFDKPVLKNHDQNADPLGRVINAQYVHLKNGQDFSQDYLMPDLNGPGSGFIRLTANISDQDAIEKFLDGRFMTVSTSQSSDKTTCSICDKEMIPPFLRYLMGMDEDEDACQHIPGRVYEIKDGKKKKKMLCYAITGELEYHEVSAVNSPGDAFAKVSEITSGDHKDSKEIEMDANSYEFVSVEDGARIHTFRVADSEGNILRPVDRSVHQVNWNEVENVSAQKLETHEKDVSPKDKAKDSLLSSGFAKIEKGKLILITDWEDENFQLALDELQKEYIHITSDIDTNEIYIRYNPPKEGLSVRPDTEIVEDEECLEGDSKSDTQVTETHSNDSSDKNSNVKKRGSAMEDDKSTEDVVEMKAAELKDLVSSLKDSEKTLKDQASNLQNQVSKLESEVSDKNEKISQLDDALTKQTSKSRKILAQALVASNVIARRPSVKEVKDKESFEEAVNKLAERTLDSLSDSLDDVMSEVFSEIFAQRKEDVKAPSAKDILEDDRTEPKTEVTDPSSNGSVDSFEQLVSKYS